MVEKGENDGDQQYFILFPQCFQKVPSSSRCNTGFSVKGERIETVAPTTDLMTNSSEML